MSGFENVGFGIGVLPSNTSGAGNIGIRAKILGSNTIGLGNVAIGTDVLNNNVTGIGSIGIGTNVLSNATAGTNIAIGYHAGQFITSGTGNTIVGFYSSAYVTGSNNTILGGTNLAYNLLGLTNGSGNTIVGANISGLSPTLTNHIIIGDGVGHQRLVIDENGNAGIGTSNPDSALTVKGGIHAKSILVDQTFPTPDYVFDKDYDLTSLKDVKIYIDQNHHLPEIPSAAQVAKEGINLGEMNAKLLKKIEELTLYLIEKDKQLKEQNNKVNLILKIRSKRQKSDQQQATINKMQEAHIQKLESALRAMHQNKGQSINN